MAFKWPVFSTHRRTLEQASHEVIINNSGHTASRSEGIPNNSARRKALRTYYTLASNNKPLVQRRWQEQEMRLVHHSTQWKRFLSPEQRLLKLAIV